MENSKDLNNEELELVRGGLDPQATIEADAEWKIDTCSDYVEDMSSYTIVQLIDKKIYDYCIRCCNYAGSSCRKGHF